jgi:galactokinase
MTDAQRSSRAAGLFRATFGGDPVGVAIAPGRVNLIGEHTDYNDGFVLPMAIDRCTTIAFRARGDGVLRVRAAGRDKVRDIPIAGLAPGVVRGWPSYVAGVAWAMFEHGITVPGADLLIDSDLPSGAGLSSSAALEVATHLALTCLAGLGWSAVESAVLTRKTEQEFVGVACGIMDQLAVASARAGHAMLIDCRSLDTEYVPLPESVSIVVMNSGVRRALAGSAYNDRRAACERVAAVVAAGHPGVTALRDVTPAALDDVRGSLPTADLARATHVVDENIRVIAAVESLRAGDLPTVGELFNASHDSLRDLYEVSGPELDTIVAAARRDPRCLGARLTGAGFGGCAIALVESAAAAAFTADLNAELSASLPSFAGAMVAHSAPGARLATGFAESS